MAFFNPNDMQNINWESFSDFETDTIAIHIENDCNYGNRYSNRKALLKWIDSMRNNYLQELYEAIRLQNLANYYEIRQMEDYWNE